MITKPTIFSKTKPEGLKEIGFDKSGNFSKTTSKKEKGNFSSNSVSKEKVQALFKSEIPSKSPCFLIENKEKSQRQLATKRKERDLNQSSLTDFFLSLNKVYEEYSKKDSNWIRHFLELINNEKLVDVTNFIPSFSESKGESLMLNSKFWVLFIEFKRSTINPKLYLEQLILIFDECLKFEINDINLIYESFNVLIPKYSKKDIFELIKKSDFKNKLPENFNLITINHFRFLLKYPDHFNFNNIEKKVLSTNSKRSKFSKSITIEKTPIVANNNYNLLISKKISSVVEIKEIISTQNQSSHKDQNNFKNEEEHKPIKTIVMINEITGNDSSSNDAKVAILEKNKKKEFQPLDIESFSLLFNESPIKEIFVISNTAELSYSSKILKFHNLKTTKDNFFKIKNSNQIKFNKNSLSVISELQLFFHESKSELESNQTKTKKKIRQKSKKIKEIQEIALEEEETEEEKIESRMKIKTKSKGIKTKIIQEILENSDKSEDEKVNESINKPNIKMKTQKKKSKLN